MIRATTLTGTREEIIESIHAMKKAGINQVAVQAGNRFERNHRDIFE
jgi:hypothetical protein